MIYKTMVNRFGKSGDIDQFKAVILKEKMSNTPTVKREIEGSSSTSSHDVQEEEKNRRFYRDFWIGKMLSQFPHHFIDMRLQSYKQICKGTLCKNCRMVLHHEKQGDKELWFSPKFGYFCNGCLHPKNGDFVAYITQIRNANIGLPTFESNDRIKENAILIRKTRPSSIKGFCYKN